MNRRDFLKATSAIVSTAAATNMAISRSAYAGGNDTIKVGMIGCGGRGGGAAIQAMQADPGVRIVAMADLFEDRLQAKRKVLKEMKPQQMDVDDDHCFISFDGYKQLIHSGVDQTDLLLGDSRRGARDHHYYFCRNELHGVRKGRWKLLLANRKNYYNYVKDRGSNEVELYDLRSDIGETRNLAGQHPEVVEELLELSKAFKWPRKLPNTGITAGKKRRQ